MPRSAKAEVIQQFAEYVSPHKAERLASYGIDFVIGRREGCYVWDLTGERRLLNCHCNGGTFNLGHRNATVSATVREGLDQADIGNHHLISTHRAALAQRLAEVLPGDLRYTVFAVGGGEAIDLAIKLARGYTRRPGVVSAVGAYHGHTGLALATGDEKYRAPFGPLASGFTQVPFGDIDALARVVGADTAAVMFETVPATLGMPIPSPDFYPQVRELCDRHGTMLIVDEIQTGLGRTGRMWGIEHFGVVPDILVTAKGLSGGIYPIAATCFRPPLMDFFATDPFIHVSTFGGAELGCLAALATIDLTAAPGFLDRVNVLAKRYAQALADLRRRHASVLAEVRQLGLFIGLRYAHPMGGPLMTKLCFDHGMFALYANNDQQVQQFLPPLVIGDEDVDESLAILDRAMSELAQLT